MGRSGGPRLGSANRGFWSRLASRGEREAAPFSSPRIGRKSQQGRAKKPPRPHCRSQASAKARAAGGQSGDGRGGKQCTTWERPRAPGSPRPGLNSRLCDLGQRQPLLSLPVLICKLEPIESHHTVTARLSEMVPGHSGSSARVSRHCLKGTQAGGQPERGHE